VKTLSLHQVMKMAEEMFSSLASVITDNRAIKTFVSMLQQLRSVPEEHLVKLTRAIPQLRMLLAAEKPPSVNSLSELLATQRQAVHQHGYIDHEGTLHITTSLVEGNIAHSDRICFENKGGCIVKGDLMSCGEIWAMGGELAVEGTISSGSITTAYHLKAVNIMTMGSIEVRGNLAATVCIEAMGDIAALGDITAGFTIVTYDNIRAGGRIATGKLFALGLHYHSKIGHGQVSCRKKLANIYYGKFFRTKEPPLMLTPPWERKSVTANKAT